MDAVSYNTTLYAERMRITDIKHKLKRLAANWPVAMLALGGLLTLVWIGALIWMIFYLFVATPRP